jgi:hypothetical protein
MKTTVSSQTFLGTELLLYRGVHAGHPALSDALLGRAVPGDIHGNVTPEDHNRGEVSALSPYTSWTGDRDVADYHARRNGSGGVILELPMDDPLPSDGWSWEPSPDNFDEQEVLLRGHRTGATVIVI